MRIRISVVDDNACDLQKIKEILEKYQKERNEPFDVQYFQNGENLWEEVNYDKRYDVYLLDVEMPGMDGIELARRIRNGDPEAYLIFITSHVGYAPSASEYGIFRYIEKSRMEERLPQAMDAVAADLERKYLQHRYYCITDSWSQERINVRDILYIKIQGKYTVFIKCDGSSSRARKPLEQVYSELDPKEFTYIDRGCIVNLSHVERIEGSMVYLRYGTPLKVGRLRLAETKKRLAQFWGME